MSKFYSLVRDIKELKESIDEIQSNFLEDNNSSEIENKNKNDIVTESFSNIENDERSYKGLFTSYKKKYQKLTNEIIQVNVKREELWKYIKTIQEYFQKIDLYNEDMVKYENFTLENIDLPNEGKEIIFLNTKLAFLEPKARENDNEYEKYEGFWNTAFNKAFSFRKTTLEERKLEAIYQAQAKQYAYLKIYFEHYRDSLYIQIPYLEESIEVAKLYREFLNDTLDTISKKILPFLTFEELFFKALKIKELCKNGEIDENLKLKDIKITENIGNLKNTKYEVYHIFAENLFYLYSAIEMAFKENILSNLISLKENELDHIEKEKINERINAIPIKEPEFGTFDSIISIDTSDERYVYSTDDIKYLNYTSYIEEGKKEIESIKQKLNNVNNGLEKIEEISNNL